jgi:hypothetical protein
VPDRPALSRGLSPRATTSMKLSPAASSEKGLRSITPPVNSPTVGCLIRQGGSRPPFLQPSPSSSALVLVGPVENRPCPGRTMAYSRPRNGFPSIGNARSALPPPSRSSPSPPLCPSQLVTGAWRGPDLSLLGSPSSASSFALLTAIGDAAHALIQAMGERIDRVPPSPEAARLEG